MSLSRMKSSVFIKDEIYSVFINVDDRKTLRAVMQDHRVMKASPIIKDLKRPGSR